MRETIDISPHSCHKTIWKPIITILEWVWGSLSLGILWRRRDFNGMWVDKFIIILTGANNYRGYMNQYLNIIWGEVDILLLNLILHFKWCLYTFPCAFLNLDLSICMWFDQTRLRGLQELQHILGESWEIVHQHKREFYH